MREIKFRAWDEIGKRMVYDFNQRMLTLKQDKDTLCFYTDSIDALSYEMSVRYKLPLMQYTGLKDKNGKEIYESDIVLGELSKEFYKGTVEFHWGCFKINFPHQNNKNYSTLLSIDNLCFDGKAKQIEVIGNIYENPKLMEESK